MFIGEVERNAVNLIAGQVRFEDSKSGKGFRGNAATAGFFPWRLRVEQRYGMAAPGEKYRSPRSGRAGTNDGYVHELLNIETRRPSILPEDEMHDSENTA